MSDRIYWVWADMIGRCTNPNHKAFKNYGGRGITVCERWCSFKSFVIDMGERPQGYLLDRKNNDGDYCPENCRWATRKEQNSNRRNCIYVDCDGDCRRKNINYRPIVKRIQNLGWPVDLALTVPLGPGKKLNKLQKAAA